MVPVTRRGSLPPASARTRLSAPGALRAAFERPDGFAVATDEATAELEAIHRYDQAASTRPPSLDLFQTLGLWGATPDADLAAARAQFASGDLAGSANAAIRSAARRIARTTFW